MTNPRTDTQSLLKGHEPGKERRRNRILAATRELMTEIGTTSFTMRMLAVRAELSGATLYNLFGSKKAVLSALSRYEVERFNIVFDETADPHPIARFFQYIEWMLAWYKVDERFYRVLVSEFMAQDAAGEINEYDFETRAKVNIRDLLEHAISRGYIETGRSMTPLLEQLYGIIKHNVARWMAGTMSLDEAQLGASFGYSLVLHCIATDKAKAYLIQKRDEMWAALCKACPDKESMQLLNPI